MMWITYVQEATGLIGDTEPSRGLVKITAGFGSCCTGHLTTWCKQPLYLSATVSGCSAGCQNLIWWWWNCL